MRRILSLFTMLMLCGVFAFAQSRVVTGKVVDANGAPVPSASIKVGTATGLPAGADGSFKITITGNRQLEISAVGYSTQRLTATDNMVVTLVRTDATMTEVIVTAAGIKRSEKALGYTVSKVNPEVLLQKSEPDVLKGLEGKVAGVDIRASNGTPGAATRIQIRGNSSFYGDNQPLIIVDGIPFSNDQIGSNSLGGAGAYGSGISDLDPNDIASMNILKGSSAAALYGSRASNGVVIITTKSGSVSRSKKGIEVTFKSSVSFENISNLPDYQNTYGTGSYGNYSPSNGSWGQKFHPGDSVAVWPAYQTAYPELFPTGKVPYQAYPNNVADLFTTGLVKENSIGFNTGDEKTSFSLTASNLDHSGYVANNTYTRTNISAGGSSKLAIGLNVRGNFSYSRSNQNGGLFGENQTGASSQFGRSMFLGRNWDMSLPYQDKQGNSIIFAGAGQFDNPYWSAQYNTSQSYNERVVAGAHMDFAINRWAHVDYNVGTNVSYLNRTEIQEVSSRGLNGSMTILDYRAQEIESTLLLSLSPNIGKNWSFKSTLGTNYNQRTETDLTGAGGVITGDGFTVRGLHTLSNFLAADETVGNFYSRRRLFGILGDATLGYRNYAFVTVTGRNDVSSTLPTASRSYFYPSVSGSFVFTDALGIKNGFLDYGKIRAGYAKVGRDADPYNTLNIFALGTGFNGVATGYVNGSANSPVLQPEFTKELELGTQLSFFKKRFELDFTYYDKKSDNMLAPITTAPSTGFSGLYTNFGGVSNKGVEIEATVRPVTNKNFSWELRAAFTKNKNIVEYLTEGVKAIPLGGGTTDITTRLEPGKPFGYLYGTKALRDSATGALLIDKNTGAILVDPDNGFIADVNPDFKLGITNSFRYKNFSLSILFDMTQGGHLYSGTVQNELSRGVTLDTKDRETGVVITGVYGDLTTKKALTDGSGKTIPNQTRIAVNDVYFQAAGGSVFGNGPNEFSVFDASVYRIREVTLAYDIPKSILKKTRIAAMTLSLSGRNLWYYAPGFPKYSHFDPETSNFGASSVQGLEFSAAPTTRRIGVNLNVTF